MMRTSVICVNDFPEMAFPPGTPDAVIQKERKRIQREYGAKGPSRRFYVHTQEVTWYEEEPAIVPDDNARLDVSDMDRDAMGGLIGVLPEPETEEEPNE